MVSAPKRAKTETLSLRLDPKTKFMLDFMSRVAGQSITTVVERAVRETSRNVGVQTGNEDPRTWSFFWDASEGVRTLNLISDQDYPTNFEEDELLSFAQTHWPFFYLTADFYQPRRPYIDVLWPKIDTYLDIWRSQRQKNYWAAGEAMAADLKAANVAAPDWPKNKKAGGGFGPREDFSADLDDEIPF